MFFNKFWKNWKNVRKNFDLSVDFLLHLEKIFVPRGAPFQMEILCTFAPFLSVFRCDSLPSTSYSFLSAAPRCGYGAVDVHMSQRLFFAPLGGASVPRQWGIFPPKGWTFAWNKKDQLRWILPRDSVADFGALCPRFWGTSATGCEALHLSLQPSFWPCGNVVATSVEVDFFVLR